MNLSFQNKTVRFCLLITLLLICYFIGRHFSIDIEHYRDFLKGFPVLISGLIFIVLYVIITFFVWFGTIDLFRISASILFGAYWATLFVWIAELINAFTLFHLSRKLGQEYVLSKFKLDPKDLNKTKKDISFFNVFTLRSNPLIPFRLMDLGYGLTRISFGKYLGAISISSLIRIFWLQLILEGVGTNIFKDTNVIVEYLNVHPLVIIFSGIYFLIVIVLTIVAVVLKLLSRKKAKI